MTRREFVGHIVGIPGVMMAAWAIFSAAAMYFSISSGDIESTSPMLSNP